MSRENVYNPVLRFLQKERLLSLSNNNPKLFSPASSKQQFFTLKRNNTKKSLQTLHSEHIKLNRSVDRKDSNEFSSQDWQSVNQSQQVYMNTSTDDEVKTNSTKSYETHEDYQIQPNVSRKKKNRTEFIQVNKAIKDLSHNNLKYLNSDKIDNLIQNIHTKYQFSNVFLPEVPVKKQRPSKKQVLLKFKENIRKKCAMPLKIKHFMIFPKLLGQGTYSKVYKAIHKKTGMICAIKIIQKQQIITSNLIDNLIEEIKIMSLYEHPNVTKLWGFFEQGPKFYMIMDYCTDGYLYKLIKEFDEKQAQDESIYRRNVDYIKQMCLAIDFLHENRIMHRDIKPQNILLTMGDTIKLSDFGWARIIHDPSQQLRKTLCGTPLYLAPEQIRQTQYSKSVDLWAIGILTYELLTGKIPFTIQSIQDLHKIVNEDVSFQQIAKFPYATEFVSLLLQKDGQKRTEANKLTEHPFFDYDSGFNQANFMYDLEFGKVL